MQNFRVDHSVAGAPPMVVWDATCVRGKQYLRVRLKNGEISNDVFVNNVYMNAVSELEVTSVLNGELKMKVGEIKDGIQVFGKTDQAAVRPELTRQDQCLAIESSQEGVLSLRRSETVALRADKAGSTKVTFAARCLAGGRKGGAGDSGGQGLAVSWMAAEHEELHGRCRGRYDLQIYRRWQHVRVRVLV